MATEVRDVIVLLPGITGSVLEKNGETIWGYSGMSMGTTVLTRGKWLHNNLELVGDHSGPESLEDGITATALIPDLHLIPGVWKIDGYTEVASTIKRQFALKPGENFFEFAYDWRRDNRSSAQQLARSCHDWLKQWRERGNSKAKLILIGHSMGGLVSRYFLEVLGGWKDTRALVTFGTPFRGSLNALDSIANGVRKGPLGLIDLSKLVRSFTSMYQLLPIYPAYYDKNGQLLRVAEADDIPNFDVAKAKDALDFHTEIWNAVEQNRGDPDWEEHGYDLFPIVGIEQETNQSGRYAGDKVELYKTYEGKDLSGDGTVPRVSAIPREFNPNQVDMYAATKHGSLQNAGVVLKHLGGRIEDFYLELGRFKSARPAANDVTVSLETEDLVLSNEPVPVRARPSQPGVVLTASLVEDASGVVLQELSLETCGDGWQECTFEPVSEGNYRVEISGADVTNVAADAVAVADATAQME